MKRIWKGIGAIALVMAMGACGNFAGSQTTSEAAYDGGYGLAESNYYAADTVAETEAYDSADMRSEESKESGDAAITGEKLVYTGSMTIETLTYEDTVKAVRERITAYKGIIQDQNEWDGDSGWYNSDSGERTASRNLSLTVRIPTESFEAFMNDMEGTGKMRNRSENVQNISRQYSDNAIEIEALETQQERLLKMMEEAQSVEEMIQVEARLSEVQTQLNQKKSRQSSMDTDVMYSTVYLNVNEVQKYTPVKQGNKIDGFGEKVMETIQESWIDFVYFLEQLALALIKILPFAAVIGLFIVIIRRIRKAKGLDPNPFTAKPKRKSSAAIQAGTVKDSENKPEQK